MGLIPKTTKYFFPVLYLLVGGTAFAPSVASAFSGVHITEILYDASGSDAGREWVEVTNFSNESTDIAKYTLQESNSNHRFSLFNGSAQLAPGQSAIITTNPAAFAAAYPHYEGTVLKAAFSLSNTGEAVMLKNASSTIVDSVTYTSAKGAQGDGSSLHRLPGGLQAGKPDPGTYIESVAVTIKKVAPVPVAAFIKVVPLTKTTISTDAPLVSKPLPEFNKTVAVQIVPLAPAAEALSPTGTSLPLIEGVIGLAALIVLGVASIWYAGAVTQSPVIDKETIPTADEFDIT